MFPGNPMGWRYSPTRNRSVYGTLSGGTNAAVDSIAYTFSNVCGYFAFCATIACTSVLVTSLKSKAKWRQQASSSSSTAAASTVSRDVRIIKLMVTISAMFIICFLPNTVVYWTVVIFSDFSINGRYNNLFFIVVSLTLDLEAINSSVNVIVYMKMNSKYRTVAQELLNWNSCSDSKGTKIGT